MKIIIYKAINIQNNKVYIGKTKSTLKQRISGHIRDKKNNNYFHNAIHKYGSQNFKWIILGCCETNNEANISEKICIEHFKSNDKRYGYNLTIGGDGIVGYKHSQEHIDKMIKIHTGRKRSKETCERISNALKGRTFSNSTKQLWSKQRKGKEGSWKNKNLPDDMKQKISKSHLGKSLSISHKQNISKSLKGRNGTWKGKKLSEETKRKMSEAHKLRNKFEK